MIYVALLRGINISGKNKLSMEDLKSIFNALGFRNVMTYINSGNVLFESQETELMTLSTMIRKAIEAKVSFLVPVDVESLKEIEEIIVNKPDWWGNSDKEMYHNLIFILPPTTYQEVYQALGEPKKGVEWIENRKNYVYWSFSLKAYPKINWIKSANSSVNNFLTIRTANTLKKIIELSQKSVK